MVIITRRQVLKAGGAIGAWAALGGRSDLTAAAAESGVDEYTLSVGYPERQLGS